MRVPMPCCASSPSETVNWPEGLQSTLKAIRAPSGSAESNCGEIVQTVLPCDLRVDGVQAPRRCSSTASLVTTPMAKSCVHAPGVISSAYVLHASNVTLSTLSDNATMRLVNASDTRRTQRRCGATVSSGRGNGTSATAGPSSSARRQCAKWMLPKMPRRFPTVKKYLAYSQACGPISSDETIISKFGGSLIATQNTFAASANSSGRL